MTKSPHFRPKLNLKSKKMNLNAGQVIWPNLAPKQPKIMRGGKRTSPMPTILSWICTMKSNGKKEPSLRHKCQQRPMKIQERWHIVLSECIEIGATTWNETRGASLMAGRANTTNGSPSTRHVFSRTCLERANDMSMMMRNWLWMTSTIPKIPT